MSHYQATTDYGLTGRTMLLSPLSISLLWPVEALSKEPSGGGLEAIGLTTGKIPRTPASVVTSLTISGTPIPI